MPCQCGSFNSDVVFFQIPFSFLSFDSLFFFALLAQFTACFFFFFQILQVRHNGLVTLPSPASTLVASHRNTAKSSVVAGQIVFMETHSVAAMAASLLSTARRRHSHYEFSTSAYAMVTSPTLHRPTTCLRVRSGRLAFYERWPWSCHNVRRCIRCGSCRSCYSSARSTGRDTAILTSLRGRRHSWQRQRCRGHTPNSTRRVDPGRAAADAGPSRPVRWRPWRGARTPSGRPSSSPSRVCQSPQPVRDGTSPVAQAKPAGRSLSCSVSERWVGGRQRRHSSRRRLAHKWPRRVGRRRRSYGAVPTDSSRSREYHPVLCPPADNVQRLNHACRPK